MYNFCVYCQNLINNYIKDLPSDDPFKRPLGNYASEIEQKYIKRKRTNIDTEEQEEIYYLNQKSLKFVNFSKNIFKTMIINIKFLIKPIKKTLKR